VVEQFAGRFEQVDVVRYPAPDGRPGRPALVATRKRPEG